MSSNKGTRKEETSVSWEPYTYVHTYSVINKFIKLFWHTT